MPRVIDPIPLYKDGLQKFIPAIDAGAWIIAGWSLYSTAESKPEELLPDNLPSDTKVLEIKPELNSSEKPLEETTENLPSDTKVESKRK